MSFIVTKNQRQRARREANYENSPHSYDTLYSHPYFWMPQHIPHTWSNAKVPVSSDYSPVDSISLHVRHIDVQYHWVSRVIPIYPIPYWQWRFHHIHIPTVMDHDTYPYHSCRANVLPIPSLGLLNHYPTQVGRMFCCNEYAIAFVVCYMLPIGTVTIIHCYLNQYIMPSKTRSQSVTKTPLSMSSSDMSVSDNSLDGAEGRTPSANRFDLAEIVSHRRRSGNNQGQTRAEECPTCPVDGSTYGDQVSIRERRNQMKQ